MRKIAGSISGVIFKILPDAFSIAIILTFAVFAGAILIEGSNPLDVVRWWGDGLFDLLEFTMQITLILVGGYLLAKTKLIDSFLTRATSKISSPKKAVFYGTVITGVAMWLNWGFGIVVAGVLSNKLRNNVPGLKPELMLASAFSTICVYGVGMSGTIPLLIASSDHFLVEEMGVIPLSETIFRPSILGTVIVLILGLAAFNAFIHPKSGPSTQPADGDQGDQGDQADLPTSSHESVPTGEPGGLGKPVAPEGAVKVQTRRLQKEQASDAAAQLVGQNSLAARIDSSRILGIGLGLIGLLYVVLYLADGQTFALNTVNTILLFLAVTLFLRPRNFISHIGEAAKTAAGVIVQYPLYAGIMGLLTASGLGITIAHAVASVSTAETLPLLSLWSGGFINLLAPSGGGQWALQGPTMIETARVLGSDMAPVALGVASGDMWTNVFHPFWILPALGIAGLKLRECMGYMLINGVIVGVVLSALFLGMGFGFL